MMRLGLSVVEVSVLFNISTGSFLQIFRTWLPFLYECTDCELVRAILPTKFTAALAQVMHSQTVAASSTARR